MNMTLKAIICIVVTIVSVSAGPVDCSTIKDKVIMGYQGWFGCEKDSISGYNWWHWSHNSKKKPGPGNLQFDVFPTLDEYPQSSLYETDLKWSNGSKVSLYSNAAEGVVNVHFRWMYEYNLDGVFVQRFLTNVQGGAALKQKNTILKQVDRGATLYNRTYAVMWDISSADTDKWAEWIKTDWDKYVSDYTTHPAYLHEGGKPVICIFGLGLKNHKPIPTAIEAISLITWLKTRAYVIGSGPYYWRTPGVHDSMKGYEKVHAAFDAIMPWSVGRYHSADAFDTLFEKQVVDDAKMCSQRKQGYAPIAYPGYSFHNSDSAKALNQIPRKGGAFMQAQINKYLNLNGASFYYIAMFDEVNEGTAIYKAVSRKQECPANANFVYLSIDGEEVSSDHYLQLTQQYTAHAHANITNM